MDNPKTEAIQILKDAQNVLVTVSKDPSVDQLAAAIGMTLALNKLGKHGTAVFSGSAPSTIEFLKPDETLEKNTDSLRDFIISLDKSKADKLRYKVEDQHVKIFITPYKTTIGDDDLVFSHGDFNVDVVLALGVQQQNELDQAITAHGRILHDAKIISINIGKAGQLGGINLSERNVSSLSEVLANISLSLKQDVLDEQIATAFLTGIVAETERFSNEKTHPETMSVSAKLMAAGANQQLVATQLQVQPEPELEQAVDDILPPISDSAEPAMPKGAQENPDSIKHPDGSLEIKHHNDSPKSKNAPHKSRDNFSDVHVDEDGNLKTPHVEKELPTPPALPAKEESPKTSIDDDESKTPPTKEEQPEKADPEKNETPKKHSTTSSARSKMILEPPSRGGDLLGATEDGSVDPLSLPPVKGKLLSHNKSKEQADSSDQSKEDQSEKGDQSESDQESATEGVESKVEGVDAQPNTVSEQDPKDDNGSNDESISVEELKSAVDEALAGVEDNKPLEPIAALNANPIDLDLGHDDVPDQSGSGGDFLDVSKLDATTGLPVDSPNPDAVELPPLPEESNPEPGQSSAMSSSMAPPPVPPPMMPPLSGSGDGPVLPPVHQ